MNALPSNARKAAFSVERIRVIQSRRIVGRPHPQTLDTLHLLSAIETERQIPVAALAEGNIVGFSSDRGVSS